MTDFWKRLWYIKVDRNSKRPLESGWGFSEDEPFSNRDTVYSFEEVNPANDYAYLAHQDYTLGVLDLDLYKDACPVDDLDDIQVPDNPLVIKSPSGGIHIPFFVAEDCSVKVNPEFSDWIDLKGKLGRGYVLAPQEGNDYEITNESDPPIIDPRTRDWVTVFSYEEDTPLLVEETNPDVDREHDTGPVTTDGSSVLWDLTLRDVMSVSPGYRGPNPLGHHGESRDYFVFKETTDGYLAYDHKHSATYQPLTYLLCEAGVRPNSDPEGRLSDYEKFQAWKHAKEAGYIAEDDQIPYVALRGVAVKNDIAGELEDGWRLPSRAYDDALAFVEREYGLDPNRSQPYSLISTVQQPTGWRDRRHEMDIGKHHVHDRVQAAVEDAIQSYSAVLINSLPTTGKSHSTVKAIAVCDEPATILTGRGRVEMYEQYREWAKASDLETYKLPSRTDCPVFRGEHGETQKQMVEQFVSNGAGVSEVHQHLSDELACMGDDNCPYLRRWDFDPKDYDVLIGHYVHAHLTNVVAGRVVVIDEFPGAAYETELGNGLPGWVSEWLDIDWTELLERRHDMDLRRRLVHHFVAPNGTETVEPDPGLAFQGIHAHTPVAVATLLYGDDLGNGFLSASFGDIRTAFNRQTQTWHSLTPPDTLGYAKSIIGLDGTPTQVLWDLAMGLGFDHRQVLDDSERRTYLKNTLGHEYVRTTPFVKTPGANGTYVNVAEDFTLFDEVLETHGEEPGLVTSRRALQKYKNEDEFQFDENEVLYYGNLLGSNKLADKQVGIVAYSQHPGDGFIQKWGGYYGDGVERRTIEGEKTRGVDLSYTGFGDDILTHMRENQTLQAVLRFGRTGKGARVYIHTNTLPEWVEIDHEVSISRFGEKQQEIVQAVLEQDSEFARRDLDVSASRQWTTDFLSSLVDREFLECEELRGRYYYRVAGDPPARGMVDFHRYVDMDESGQTLGVRSSTD